MTKKDGAEIGGQSHRTLLLGRPKGCLVSEVFSVAVDGHGLQSEPGVPFSIHVDTSDSHQLGAGGSLQSRSCQTPV